MGFPSIHFSLEATFQRTHGQGKAMNAQYQQERQVTSTIDRYHHQAMRAKQVRLAQGDQPGRFVTITMSVRATLNAIQARFHRVPAALPEVVVGQEPISVQEPVVTPAESAAIA